MPLGDRAAARAATMGPALDAALESPAAARWIPRLFWTPVGFALGTVFGWLVF